ncbi:MAG: S-adenosylmethionine:tRNA ribosyltransferase-isomerase [Bacteroidales bacterium]|nr:S-adenosylmethionine:tRNA ribosyltransferase-isomerase [Bacteroidales bacterium]
MSNEQPDRSFVEQISIADFSYPLPDERIARYPCAIRDQAKLLLMKGDCISEDVFSNIGAHLPHKALLVWNETKVIHARLLFVRQGGARIELFCLGPANGMGDIQQAYAATASVDWNCLVGNSRRWKHGTLEQHITKGGREIKLLAERLHTSDSHSVIRFSWSDTKLSFAQLLELMGEVPLPPYLHRMAEDIDTERYQTVYANQDGSVAAPTAGLHFTKKLIEELKRKQFSIEKLTLHVGAGTFKPVAHPAIGQHSMHSEKIIVHSQTIENIIQATDELIAVGTTTMRCLESLYWLGIQLLQGNPSTELHLTQWFPYENPKTAHIDAQTALSALLDYMHANKTDQLHASTALMIAPGYRFKIAKGLITNFHQPKSTLLLLVAALMGETWKKGYEYALQHDFRFLSYGDSCLMLP